MEDKSKYRPKFIVPENYFEELDERVMQSIQEDLLPRSAGFGVPDDYFENVTETILDKTIKGVKLVTHPAKVIPLYRRSAFVITASVAACIAIAIAIGNFNSTNASLDNLQSTAISEYIEDGNLDISSTDLIPYFQDEEIDALIFGTEEISSETISDYLLNNLDDSTLLTEER